VAFLHAGDHLVSVSVRDCAFMRLRGAFAGPAMRVELGATPGLRLYVRNPTELDAPAVYGLLEGAPTDLPTGTDVLAREVGGSLTLWLALREPGFCWLEAVGAGADEQPVPELYAVPGKYRSACGVLERTSAAFYMRPPGGSAPTGAGEPKPFELYVRNFGRSAETARRLCEHARAWNAAGRPGSDGLRIRALPIDVAYAPAAHEQVIEKRWTRLVLDWPDRTG
jgi:protein-L-isoaspartate(D-aspartate) O-methyltransferase